MILDHADLREVAEVLAGLVLGALGEYAAAAGCPRGAVGLLDKALRDRLAAEAGGTP